MSSNLDSTLKQDQACQKTKLVNLMWFHPKINRKNAETRIHKSRTFFARGNQNGIYLVRENQLIPGDYILSFSFDKKIAHFKINESRSLHYSVESGPIKKGLDQLIEFYCGDCSNLPTKLSKPAKGGELPPPLSTGVGYTNLLHKALKEEDQGKAKAILAHKRCPQVDTKNENGATALHLAAMKGLDEIVKSLLEHDATVDALDAKGNTALHQACRRNHAKVATVLIDEGEADVQYRHFESGNVPLHEATINGHLECVKVLLKKGACVWPRNNKELTPYELASQHQHASCASYLDDFKPPPAKTYSEDWLHEDINRRGALALIEKHGIKDGLFLVRKSSRHANAYVLTFSCKGQGFNYEIRSWSANKGYSLDSGPFFLSVEHLVEYYCLHRDGLECKLRLAIKSDSTVKPLILNKEMEELYMSENLVARVSENGFTEYSLAAGLKRHDSASSTNSGDYQIPEAKTLLFGKKQLQGHILKSDSIELGYELGQGEFGEVMKGVWTRPDGQKCDVAVKTLREEYISSGKASFLSEAAIMVSLDHPCIVSLIGVCEDPLMLVQELVQLGSLLDFLLDYPEKIDAQFDLYLWAAQLASGMLYLEKERFVHRDLAARNILLQDKKQVKVGDFGLSRAVSSDDNGVYKASTGGRWPVRWYAPEAINYGQFSHASDVWSYGVTLWEMFTFGDQPYEDKTGAEVAVFLEKKGRLAQPKDCPDSTYDMMLKCWMYDPAERKTFKELLDFFNAQSGTGNMSVYSNHSSC